MTFTKKQTLFLTACFLLYTTLFIYTRFHSTHDPTSYFFQPEIAYQPQYSITRVHETLHFLSSLNNNTSRAADSPTNRSLCVGIVTVRRPLEQKLDITVGSLLEGLTEEERTSVVVHVLFAHARPADHPDYEKPWVSRVVDRALTYRQLDAPMSTLRRLEIKKQIPEKSLIDYRLALESCHKKSDAPWTLMLEDDVLAQRHWYEDTMRAIQTVERWERSGSVGRWLYLRLFYTEKFLGWNVEKWPVYLAWAVAVVCMTGVMGVCARRQVRSWRGVLTNSFLVVVCLVCVPLVILLYFLAGRITVQPMRPGVHLMNRHGCCSQALLFPRESVPLLVDYLALKQRTSPHPVDSVVESLGDEEGLDRFAVSPSQVQHVGPASYKENRPVYRWEGRHRVHGAHGVWNVGFERAYP